MFQYPCDFIEGLLRGFEMFEGIAARYEIEGFAFERKNIRGCDTIGAFFVVRRDFLRPFDIETDGEIRARLLLYK